MIYTPLTIKAMQIAYKAHSAQLDVSGVPYIFHPYHIVEQMNDELTVCIALLHDVIEDTDITLEELEKNFPAEIIDVLKLLTHKKGEDYFEYIKRIKENPAAKAVKLADIAHNCDFSRVNANNSVSQDKLEHWRNKYLAALKILEEQ